MTNVILHGNHKRLGKKAKKRAMKAAKRLTASLSDVAFSRYSQKKMANYRLRLAGKLGAASEVRVIVKDGRAVE